MLCIAAFAQPLPPYPVILSGHVNGCSPANSVVTITTVQNTQPAITMTVQLDANCNYFEVYYMDSPLGWFEVSIPCQGAIQSGSGSYTVNSFDTMMVVIDLNCGGSTVDCLGVLNGSALPGTVCTTAFGSQGTWSSACSCVANTASCQACFTVEQTGTPVNGTVPFSASFSNCSIGGVAPFTYAWTFDGGVTFVNDANPVIVFTAGTYLACLTVADANGCVNTSCDSLVVDSDGTINPTNTNVDCLGIPNGPNTPGSACSLTFNEIGTWDNNCICQPDSSAVCEAGFWVLQAYTIDSLNPNGSGTPIPNEVWVWNLSSGTGNISYSWDFGDGTTSSDAFPTHIYADGGPYLLCLTMTDASNCTSTFCDTLSVDSDGLLSGMIGHNEDRAAFTVNVLQELPTTINEQERIEEIALWPNPVADAITLSLLSTTSGRLDVSILDLNGRLINTFSNIVSTGKNSISVPVELSLIHISEPTSPY